MKALGGLVLVVTLLPALAWAPPVRSVVFTATMLRTIDHRGTRTLLTSAIPATNNTAATVETYINTVWIPANISGYQMQVHVFTRSPLRLIVWTGNLGETVPPDWWVRLPAGS